MVNFEGVIFDLDGTLVDSMHVWTQVDIDFLGKRGFDVPEDYPYTILPMGYIEAADYTIQRFGLNEKRDDIIDEWKRMAIEAYTNDVKIKSGVKEYLDYLKEKGVKMAIATASDMNLVEPVLKSNGIYDYFQNITTAKEVRRGKGFPDIYDVAAHKMGIEPEKCIVFEDILQGIKGAIAGNYTAIAVYDKASDNDREEIKRLAYRYIADFREMIN